MNHLSNVENEMEGHCVGKVDGNIKIILLMYSLKSGTYHIDESNEGKGVLWKILI